MVKTHCDVPLVLLPVLVIVAKIASAFLFLSRSLDMRFLDDVVNNIHEVNDC